MNNDTVTICLDQHKEGVRKVRVEGHHRTSGDRQYDGGRRGYSHRIVVERLAEVKEGVEGGVGLVKGANSGVVIRFP